MMKRTAKAPHPGRRGAALLIVLILVAVLTGGTLAMVNLASTDIDIAAAGRQEAISFAVADSALDEILTDERTNKEIDVLVPGVGFAPNPDHPTLEARYPDNVAYINTPSSGGRAEGFVHYVRQGVAFESSAIEVQTVVYDVTVVGDYLSGAGTTEARRDVAAEFYRFSPRAKGTVSRLRHFQ